MRDYRAYILGIDGHRFVWAKDYVADQPNDAAALSAAKGLTDKHDVEVWDGGRLVARLSPEGEVSPELAPSLAFTPPSGCENRSATPTEPVYLNKVSEVVLAACSESKPLVE
jgi:hypothetical protein